MVAKLVFVHMVKLARGLHAQGHGWTHAISRCMPAVHDVLSKAARAGMAAKAQNAMKAGDGISLRVRFGKG